MAGDTVLRGRGDFGDFAVRAITHPGELLRRTLGAAAEQIPIYKAAILAGAKGWAEGAVAGV